jgi:predicted glycoside hydrolase/deacetylase ChbG (UPF0249 family)
MELRRLGLTALLFAARLSAQPAQRQLLLRLDDVGLNHSVNDAIRRVADAGIPFSASVLVVAPAYGEAVEILKAHPNISVGVHLALNAEWRNYRWGPVLGRTAVPSLVDSLGHFLSSTRGFLAHHYDLGEVERELGAQVDRALTSGLTIDYVDYHMGTAVSTPELRAVVERVAAAHHLGVSRYFGESVRELWGIAIGAKRDSLLSYVAHVPSERLGLLVVHVAEATPEMNALFDLNAAQMNSPSGEPLSGRHRQAELDALLSPTFAAAVRDAHVRLSTYRDVIAARGLAGMHAPR